MDDVTVGSARVTDEQVDAALKENRELFERFASGDLDVLPHIVKATTRA